MLYILGASIIYYVDGKIKKLCWEYKNALLKDTAYNPRNTKINNYKKNLLIIVFGATSVFIKIYPVKYMLQQPICTFANSLGCNENITKALTSSLSWILPSALKNKCWVYSTNKPNKPKELNLNESIIITSLFIPLQALALHSFKCEMSDYPKIFLICSFSTFLSENIIAYLTGEKTLEIIKNEVTSYKSVAKIALRSAADVVCAIRNEHNFKYLSLKCLEISAIASACSAINSSI